MLSVSSILQALPSALFHNLFADSLTLSVQEDTVPSAVPFLGIQHADIRLEPRQFSSPSFTLYVLKCLQLLRVPIWSTCQIPVSAIHIHKVSGSLTNTVFFVSDVRHQQPRVAPTLVLRIYGSSSASLISRPRELRILHVLSTQYNIGPLIYGTFENGRVEEYFDSSALTPSDIRDSKISRWIGVRMAQFHQVEIERLEPHGWEIGVLRNVNSWLLSAEKVLALPTMSEKIKREIGLTSFKKEWERYLSWLSTVDDVRSGSKRVFAHNDTQYGNILRMRKFNDSIDEHRQLVVVDFEYASPNPASFDIANHFHEWTANYHSSSSHRLNPSLYPNAQQRRNFYSGYLAHADITRKESSSSHEQARRMQLAALDEQVLAWSPASHAMWGIWGIVQARSDVQENILKPEFDYLSYSICRLDAFRREIYSIGL